MNRLLIVEDEPDIRESLVDFFAGRDYVTEAVASLGAARQALDVAAFSLILLDLRLPDGDGLDLLRERRAAGDRTPVIVVTARDDEARRVQGLRLGADDYVVKPFSVFELEARIEAVLRRATGPTPTTRLGDIELDLAGFRVLRGEESARLLVKEAELLGFLLRHPGRTFRRDELLRAVWGYDATPTTRTVDTHVFNLRKKLEPDPEHPRHLMTVRGVGYRLDP